MNPNLFLINTDYLTLAKNNSTRAFVVIPQTTLQDYDITASGYVDIPIATAKGAIPVIMARYLVGDNSGPWVPISGWFTFSDDGDDQLFWRIAVKRLDDTTMRMDWVCVTLAHHYGITIPQIELEVAISTFYPPNVV